MARLIGERTKGALSGRDKNRIIINVIITIYMNNKYTKYTLGIAGLVLMFALVFASSASADNGKGKGKGQDKEDNERSSVSCKIPWGHLFAPGWLKKNNAPTVAADCSLPKGIARLFHRESNGGTDTVAPSILSVSARDITKTAATIRVSTDEKAKVKVNYGTTTSYGSTTPQTSSFDFSTSVSLTGLSADTTYHYDVVVTDAAGNTRTSSDYTFKTKAASADVTAPDFVSVSVRDITQTGATVRVSVDEKATVKVNYGTTTSYGSTTTETTDFKLVTDVPLSGLTVGTLYHYNVVVTDSDGNSRTLADSTFSTLAGPASVISGIGFSALTNSGVTLSWVTDVNTSSKIYYSTTTPVNKNTASVSSDTTLKTAHSMALSGLSAATTYHFLIEATTNGNQVTTAPEFSFTTAN